MQEAPVGAPEQYLPNAADASRCNIDPANAPTHEAMPLDERHHFFILHDPARMAISGANCRISERRLYGTTCQFADNKRMALHFGETKKRTAQLAMRKCSTQIEDHNISGWP